MTSCALRLQPQRHPFLPRSALQVAPHELAQPFATPAVLQGPLSEFVWLLRDTCNETGRILGERGWR